MYQSLNRKSGLYFTKNRITSQDNSDTATLQISVGKIAAPGIGVDESYTLNLNGNRIILNAANTIGALHGLETIRQLLTKSNDGNFYFPAVVIQDAPRFPWRGLSR